MSLTMLLGKILTGAWTGYITNSLAINMLFKEYGVGKFKLGGVVVKTRKEFTENVSSLVENNIINEKTLQDQLLKEDFTKGLEGFVVDFLHKSLYQNTNNLDFGDIPAFEKSTQNIINYLDENLALKLIPLVEIIIKNVEMKDLITSEQIEYVSNSLYTSILTTLESGDFLEKTIEELYVEKNKEKLSDLIDQNVFQTIITNFKTNTRDLHLEIENNFDLEIDNVINSLFQELKLTQIVEKLENELKNKDLIYFFGSENGQKLSKTLLEEIKNLINSTEGRIIINSFSEQIFSFLRNTNSPILNLLSADLKNNLEGFLIDKLPIIVQEIMSWVQKNKTELENLIEDAIDETIEEAGEIKGAILKTIRGSFLQNVAEKYDLVANIISHLESNTDLISLSNKVSREVINYLQKTNVSSMIKNLEAKGILNPDKLSSLIEMNINKQLDNVPDNIFEQLLYTNLGDIVDLNFSKNLEEALRKKVKKEVTTKFFYTSKLTNSIQDKVSEKATDLISQSLNEVYEKDQLAENMPRIKANILSKARKNHQVIELKLGESINGYLHEKSLGELLESANKDKMMHLINDKLSLKIQDNFTRLKGTPVSTSLDKLNAISQIEEKTTFLVSNVLRDNLNLLLQNNIKTAVATNLSTLKDEEIQKIIEEFMGKELKPITYLGAGLGGIVGASLYNFNLGTNFAGYSTSFLIFALLGYLTNVIAIQMLFKPYKSHKIFGYNVQGVISKQKPKFAKSLGKFVDKELLAKNSVSSLFTEKREIILANLQEKFSRDNYQVLEEIILKSSDKIFNEVVESTRIYLDKNGKVLSNKFLAELEDFDLTDFDLAKIEQELGENTLEKVKNSTDLLAKEIYEFLQSETSINEILPDFLKLKLENTLQKETALKVTELLEFIKDEQSVNKIVKDYSYKFTEVQERSLNELVSREQKLKINKTLNTYIKERITSAKGNEKIYTLIEEKLLKEIDSHKKIGELFDGSLIKVLNDNGSYIIKGLIEEIEGSLKDSKDEIAQMAIDVTLNNLGFLEKAGYKMLGGDDLIHQIISNLADKKLPKFLETKNYELGTIFEGFINNVVAKSEIGDLKLDLKQQEVRSMVDNLLDNPEVGKQIEIISTGILDYLLEVKLSKYTHVLGIEDLSDLVKAFEVEIALLRKELANSIYHKQEKITNITSNLVLKIITDLILDKPLNKMTAGILYEDIASATQKLTLSLYESEATRKNVNKFIMALLKDEIKAKNLNKLMDFTELNQGLNMVIQNLLKNEEMAEQILAEQKIIPDLLLDLNYACESESKDFVIEVVLKSILKSAEYNINNILQAIDFEKVTEKEVNNMQTEEIEDLFNSFAGGYFRKLESYGLFGGVFGLHYGISIVSFLFNLKAHFKNKINNKRKEEKIVSDN